MNNKILAPLYFIAFVACLVTFFSAHRIGYLVGAVAWLMLGIFYLIKSKDDNDLGS